jgi:hypothetical protein
MRRPTFIASLSFALISFPIVSAAQHAAVAPVVPAAPAVRAVPMHAAPGLATRGAIHAPRPYAPNRNVVHGTVASASRPPARSLASSNVLPRTGWHSSSQPPMNPTPPQRFTPTLPTYPPLVPNSPVLLPGNIFSGQACFSPYNCFPVPGNGFDYTHFFAVHPNWGSPILTAGVVVPFGGGGGFYLPIPYYSAPAVAPEEEQPQPPQNNNNNPAEPYQGYNGPNQQVVPQQQSAPMQGYYAPSEPVYEYVFVKRDGTKIFAVAYSLTRDNLQYVTKEGLRRTLPLSALDLDATQKSNEERGNTITLPSPPRAAMAMAL